MSVIMRFLMIQVAIFATIFVSTTTARSSEKEILNYLFPSKGAANSHFVHWSGENANGLQIFTPVEAHIDGKISNTTKFDLSARTAHIISRYDNGIDEGQVSTLTDTVLQARVSHNSNNRIQPFATVVVNAPTGRSTLSGSDKLAIMDRDLVFQTRFGEGWNFNPAVGITIPINNHWILSTGVGYNWRNEYTPDGDTLFEYNPGDQLNITSGISYFSNTFKASLNALFTREYISTLADIKYFNPGDSLYLVAQAAKGWTNRHTSQASLQFAHTQTNKSLNLLSGTFAKDVKNSNSDLFVASLSHYYRLDPRWTINGKFTYLYRGANLYDEVNDFYVSAKKKTTLEMGLSYALSDSVQASGSIGYLDVRQDNTPYLPQQTFKGVIGHVSTVIKF